MEYLRLRRRAILLLLLGLATFFQNCATQKIVTTSRLSGKFCTYIVDATTPESEKITVTMAYNDVQFGTDVVFAIPAWAPGAYQFIEYGKFVSAIVPIAENGDTLPISQIQSCMWQIQKAEKLRSITYQVQAMKNIRPGMLWVETTEINSKRVYFNGTNVFGYIDGFKGLPCEVIYKLPIGWRVASAIEIAPNTTEAVAKDYDELVDAPVLMGAFQRVETRILNKPHHFVVDSDELFQADSLTKVTAEIVKAHYNLFGELPYEKYMFLLRLVRPKFLSTYGALEHRNSSAYYMPVGDWRKVRYDQLTNTISHEFFHLWNPKRIHSPILGGKENGGFDYQNKIYTPNIWFIEGMTDYYADMLLVRNGIISQKAFLEGLLQRFLYMNMLVDERVESLESLSMRLSSVENSSEMIPFYVKGTLAALMLDIELRALSNDQFSADSLVIKMNEQFGKPQKSYSEDSLIFVANQLSGVNLLPFYAKYVIGVDSLNIETYLKQVGLDIAKKDEEAPFVGYLALPDSSDNVIVSFVSPNSEAEKMGVQAGDEIVEVDGLTNENKDAFIQRVLFYEGQKAGDSTRVVVRRGETATLLRGKVGSRRVKRQNVIPLLNAGERERRRRYEMFGF